MAAVVTHRLRPSHVPAVVVACLLALWVGTGAATAHEGERPTESSPATNEILTDTPDEVRLTFDSELEPGGSTLELTGPDGDPIALGPVDVVGTVVRADVTEPFTDPGVHAVAYAVVFADEHEASGEIFFDYRPEGADGPGSGQATEESTVPDDGDAAASPGEPSPSPSPNPRPGDLADEFLDRMGDDLPAEREPFWNRGRIIYGIALLLGMSAFAALERATRPGRR